MIEAFTKEASAGQLTPTSTPQDLGEVSVDPIHPVTGQVYAEGAEPGDVLAVTLHSIEVGDWAGPPSSPDSASWADVEFAKE